MSMKCLLTKLLVFILCIFCFMKIIQYGASSILYSGISKTLITQNNYDSQGRVIFEKEQWLYLKKTTDAVYSGIRSQIILDGAIICCLSLVFFLKAYKKKN